MTTVPTFLSPFASATRFSRSSSVQFCNLSAPAPNSQPVLGARWAPTWRLTHLPRPTPPKLALPGAIYDERPPLTLEDILAVVEGRTPDIWVDDIVHTLLGYVEIGPDEQGKMKWDCSAVPESWTEEYGTVEPPEFIGGGGGEREVDQVVKFAVRKLNKEVEKDYKQILKAKLGPLGFKGWTVKDLNPNRTRRATTMNWTLYYLAKHYGE